MRRLTTAILLLSATACTNKLATPPAEVHRPIIPEPTQRGDLIGLNAEEVVGRLGQPALQVREGDSLKLQFRGRTCILDAYLYRANSGEGTQRVNHVDTRDREGRDVDQTRCLASLQTL